MQKKSLGVLLLTLLLISFVLAQNSSSNNSSNNQGANSPSSSNADVISKAYQCLQNQIDAKDQNSISFQEATFGILAIGSNSKLVKVLEDKMKTENHWQESANPLKDTAQGMLAYNRINKNTDKIKNWILSKKQVATDLTWYLEIDIDNHRSASCTLSYGGEQQRQITVNDDMTLSGNPGSCLSVSQGGFWLKVNNNNNCLDNNYTISCDQDFTTSTLYQRTSSSTIFVSSVAHSSSALGNTLETIKSKCLSSSSNSCDYEGTLWAAIVLDKTGNKVDEYIPYLLALSESNKRFLPSSFIYLLTDGQDQYSELIQLQQQNKFWQAPNTLYNRYYDSSLAMLSLQGSNSLEVTNSKSYFESITTPEGCWNNNNIRDTGFLLYAGWPKFVSGGSGGGGGGSAQKCESAGNTCMSLFACSELNGNPLEQFRCDGTKVCCSESPKLESCSALSGSICSLAESCSGKVIDSTDGSCCLGTCEIISGSDQCTQAGGSCYDSCNDDEQTLSESCTNTAQVCCKKISDSSGGSNVGLWITILLILIVLIVVAILMRNKIKMLIFKSKNKPGPTNSPRGPIPPGSRPPFPPFRGPVPYPRAQPRMVGQQTQSPMRQTSTRDKEMEETMAKLKEMSR